MKTTDKLGLAGIITGILIPIVGLICSTIALAQAEEDKTIPVVGVIVSVMSWGVWVIL